MRLKNLFRGFAVNSKIAVINTFPRMVGAGYKWFWKPKNPIEKQIDIASNQREQFQFLQIGANDGIINDPILKFILRDNWSGIRVEPLPAPFKKLQLLHRSHAAVQPMQSLVAESAGVMSLYHLSFSDKRWATGLASLNKQSLQKQIDNGHVERRAKKFGDRLPKKKSEWVSESNLDVQGVNELIEKKFNGGLNLLQIDTEGYDYILVNALDLDKHQIEMICFEKLHIPEQELEPCIGRLEKFGYEITSSDMDILACLKSAI